jgi:hypothetical protein
MGATCDPARVDSNLPNAPAVRHTSTGALLKPVSDGHPGSSAELVMDRWSTCAFVFGILLAASCGPQNLEENRFPPRIETGYPDGRGSVGAAGTPPPVAGAGGVPMQGSSGAAGMPPATACPNDITTLFDRPIQEGGCRGPGCHIPGNTSPDLMSPNPAERLLNVASTCDGRPYISADDSFLAEKITDDSPACGAPMPFLMQGNLSTEDEACILEWIAEVSDQ